MSLACSDGSREARPEGPPVDEVQAEPSDDLEPMEIADFNTSVQQASASGETWPGFATLVALRLVGESIEFSSRSIEIESAPELFSTATITIVDDGYMDDAVRGSKHRLELVKQANGVWTLTKAWRGWRCRRAETQGFTASPCP